MPMPPPCPACKGLGRFPNPKFRGKGGPSPFIACIKCQGDGYDRDKAPLPSTFQECSTCDGEGNCPTCEGTGLLFPSPSSPADIGAGIINTQELRKEADDGVAIGGTCRGCLYLRRSSKHDPDSYCVFNPPIYSQRSGTAEYLKMEPTSLACRHYEAPKPWEEE